MSIQRQSLLSVIFIVNDRSLKIKRLKVECMFSIKKQYSVAAILYVLSLNFSVAFFRS